MIALLQMRLRDHLRDSLAHLRLLGQSAKGDVEAAPKVFIGDTPPKRKKGQGGSDTRELPCVIIVPLSGHLQTDDGATESETVMVICCCVYNPESGTQGDLEEVEGDLANLLSAVIGALLPCSQGVPLNKRFILSPDERGRLLSWIRPEEQPKHFSAVTITSRWQYKGWE
jgi:hypothetical protein